MTEPHPQTTGDLNTWRSDHAGDPELRIESIEDLDVSLEAISRAAQGEVVIHEVA